MLFIVADINNEHIVYVLNDQVTETDDEFKFTVEDSRPNVVKDLTFYITWSLVEFTVSNVSATETQKFVEVPVIRKGSLRSVSVQCLYLRLLL